jgi:hypothetical protein
MRVTMLAGMLLVLALPGVATAYDDPKALVDAIYEPYQRTASHPDLKVFYSARLNELFAVHAQRVTVDEAEAQANFGAAPDPGFNPFIDAQSPLLFDLKIGEPLVLGDEALVTVSFHNFDHPSLLSLALIKEADGWKVDDVTSTGAGENWMLSWLLLYDPWDVK